VIITKGYIPNDLYIIQYIIFIMKWKYSLQFMNEEGNWQEVDVFESLQQAFESKNTLSVQMSKVVDLETSNEVYNS